MNEAEWLAGTDPAAMLEFLEDKASARTFRLYQCAVSRQLWPALEKFDRQTIEVAERHFDTANGSQRPATKRRVNKHLPEEVAGYFVEELVSIVLDRSPEYLPILRCVFGNPFRPITIPPTVLAWNDSAVVRLAQAAYYKTLELLEQVSRM